MDAHQIRPLQPAMAAFAADLRDCFKHETTFGHFQRYMLGLQAGLDRKSIEPIALVAGVAVRTLQEFLQFFEWDHGRVNARMPQRVKDRHGSDGAIGALDPSAHPSGGQDAAPGVRAAVRIRRIINFRGRQLRDPSSPAVHRQRPRQSVRRGDWKRSYLPKSWAEDGCSPKLGGCL